MVQFAQNVLNGLNGLNVSSGVPWQAHPGREYFTTANGPARRDSLPSDYFTADRIVQIHGFSNYLQYGDICFAANLQPAEAVLKPDRSCWTARARSDDPFKTQAQG